MDAIFKQALWQLAGAPLPRDLAGARIKLRFLADSGHADAQLIAIALTANGSGSAADWPSALAMLQRAAPHNTGAQAQIALLDAMALDDQGAPANLPPQEDLVSGGSIRRARGFLTPAECAHVALSAADLLSPAQVVDPRTGRRIPHPIRTSEEAVIGPVREDLVVRAVNLRVAAISESDVKAGEALTVLRYRPGQEFKLHSDALPETRNQRVKTVLIYLNHGFEGGETTFPKHGLTICPAGGDAIIFTNTIGDFAPDPDARHAGLPVTRGVKWLATRWIRAQPFDVWQGPDAV